LPARQPPAVDWPFLKIECVMSKTNTTDASYRRLVALLEMGSSVLWKAWRLSPTLVWLGRVVFVVLAAAFVAVVAAIAWAMPPTLALSRWVLIAIIVAIALGVGVFAVPTARQHAGRIGLGLFGLVACLPVQLYLRRLNRSFLERGKLEQLT